MYMYIYIYMYIYMYMYIYIAVVLLDFRLFPRKDVEIKMVHVSVVHSCYLWFHDGFSVLITSGRHFFDMQL